MKSENFIQNTGINIEKKKKVKFLTIPYKLYYIHKGATPLGQVFITKSSSL